MRMYAKNIRAKFHSDSIWNDGSLGFFEDGRSNTKKNNKNKMTGYNYEISFRSKNLVAYLYRCRPVHRPTSSAVTIEIVNTI